MSIQYKHLDFTNYFLSIEIIIWDFEFLIRICCRREKTKESQVDLSSLTLLTRQTKAVIFKTLRLKN